MRKRITQTANRARYAAVSSDIGGAVGGLLSRDAASSGAAAGALMGTTVGEKRATVDMVVEQGGRLVG